MCQVSVQLILRSANIISFFYPLLMDSDTRTVLRPHCVFVHSSAT